MHQIKTGKRKPQWHSDFKLPYGCLDFLSGHCVLIPLVTLCVNVLQLVMVILLCVCVTYHTKALYDFYFSTPASNLGNVEYTQF